MEVVIESMENTKKEKQEKISRMRTPSLYMRAIENNMNIK